MKRLDYKVSIYKSDNLEYVGDFDKNHVYVVRNHEIVPDSHYYLLACLIMFLFLFVISVRHLIITNNYEKILHENQELKVENELLKSYISATEHELNVEILAGKYATLRTPTPTDMNEVYKMCIQSGAWYPEIIMAQFILESGSGISQVALNARNFYGMKYIGIKGRPTLQIPDMNFSGYGMYLNWQHSVLDRVLWDDYVFNKTIPTKAQYLDKISCIYAEDPNYINKLLPIACEWQAKTDSLRMIVDHGDMLIQ